MTPQEKQEADKKARELREEKARCIELACRTISHNGTPDEHVVAAEKYFNFINS